MRHHRLSPAAVFIFALCACSSVPTPPMPDGRTRTSINSVTKIEEFGARADAEMAQVRHESSMQRQVNEVKQDLANLRIALVALAAARDDRETRAPANRPDGAQFHHQPAPQEITPEEATARETVEVHEQSLVFRIAHPFGETDPTVSPRFQDLVLRASRAAGRIEIRGRTDASVADAANGRIALSRARAARAFLIRGGIPPDKISLSHLAAGGFVADNDSAAGKARNRRVEIEAMDLPAASLVSSDQPTRETHNEHD